MSYTAEIINVGTELLLGNVLNSNAQMLSEGLSELGINVYYHTVVGDNPERLKAAAEIARQRSDILITTGGLGPTCDDLTKQTLAEAFGKRLYLDKESEERIRSYFESSLHKAGMPLNNLRQAMLPEGCEIFRNEWGTAPGCAFEAGGKHVVMLPGPPRECVNMFRYCAVPYLKKLSDSAIFSKNVRVFGLGESEVEDKLKDMMLSMENPTLAPYAKEGEVLLRVTVKTDDPGHAESLMAPVLERLSGVLGSYIYTTEHDSLEELALSLLIERGLTIAAAESCTGGMFSEELTNIPGASKAFKGSVVAYTEEVKEKLLGVDAGLIAEKGVVSREVAEAMARGAVARLGADIGIGITGLAGPGGGGPGAKAELGAVFVALCAGGRCFCRDLLLGSGRYRVRIMATKHAFDMVRRYILGLDMYM